MTVRDRLIDFLDYKNISQSRFEKACDLSNGFVNNIGKSIRGESLEKISAKYPELNRSWLMLGEGNMILTDDSPTKKTAAGNDEVERLRVQVAQLIDKIDHLNALIQSQTENLKSKDEIIELLKMKNQPQPIQTQPVTQGRLPGGPEIRGR